MVIHSRLLSPNQASTVVSDRCNIAQGNLLKTRGGPPPTAAAACSHKRKQSKTQRFEDPMVVVSR